MSDSTRDLLIRGIAAAKSGNPQEAAFYLEWALRLEPPLEQKIDAWYWLSEIQPDKQLQREYVEQILILDPSEGRARRKLAMLDGKIDPAEVIDPDRLESTLPDSSNVVAVESFTCSKCGGRLTYAPDGRSLQCEYCATRQLLDISSEISTPIPETDFTIAMATRRGHIRPVMSHGVECRGCGVELILDTGLVSHICPYCQTSFAFEQIIEKEMIPPDSILPFEITLDQALSAFTAWQNSEMREVVENIHHHLIYLAVWTFDMGGQVTWRCQVKKGDDWLPLDGHEIVYHNDLPVFATRRLPAELRAGLSGYDFSKMVAFDRRYLAGSIAENYQISAGDASLLARQRCLEAEREKILSRLPSQVDQFRINSTKMIVEAFRLVLLPACLVQYSVSSQRYQTLVNGQTGKVLAQKPSPRRKSLFSRLFG